MDRFGLWWKCLFAFGILLLLFGIGLAFFDLSRMLDVLASKSSGTVYWRNRIVPVSVASSGIWIYGIAGSIIAGVGAIWSFLVYVPFRGKQKWSWVCLLLGSGIWFVIGATLSAVHNEWAGLLIHFLLMALIGFPLMKTRKNFS